MQKHTVLYKKAAIMLLLAANMLCGCSSEKETEFIEESPKASEEASEETPIPDADAEDAEEDIIEAVITEVNWESYFDGINGSAVIYNPSDNSYQIYNQETALSQRSPCSTFKIISSLPIFMPCS